MRRTSKPKVRDVKPARDAILGNQYNYSVADLTRVESLLDQIVTFLREPLASVRVERDDTHTTTIVVTRATEEVRFLPRDMAALGALQRDGSAPRREDIYLARFVLNETYARWDRYYLPLAGTLLDAPLRLSDRGDQALSSAGVLLKDVRQALAEFNKMRLVILGEPGAGKTTTLHRLALDLARERLRDPLHGKLPFRADLFKYSDERQPSDFLRTEWESSGLSETYGEAVAQGQVCFLLDGVNQMPLADRARRVERWAHWADAELPPGNWAVFTCRNADYVTDLRLAEVRVQTLDVERMRRYLELRFGAEHTANIWRDFEKQLHAGDDRFERLARNPFMLSQLADRLEEGKPITSSRSLLMDDLAQRLLEPVLKFRAG